MERRKFIKSIIGSPMLVGGIAIYPKTFPKGYLTVESVISSKDLKELQKVWDKEFRNTSGNFYSPLIIA